MALQQSLSSSPQAIEASLRSRAERHVDEREILLTLADRCHGLQSAKEVLLLDVLGEIGREPALIFTLRLETAYHLREVIQATGRRAECYVGALSRQEREDLVQRFTTGALDTLIATDAGAEGVNLHHHCHTVFNYDLHWNPMRIEQRIGRVHRIGQTQDVAVYNFALRDTVDDYVLQLLFQKINLFTMTIGELESVLSEVQEGDLDIEGRILESLLRSESRDDLRAELDSFAGEFTHASVQLSASTSLTTEALG
jgi:SNF2 family DNA or RNA helicase